MCVSGGGGGWGSRAVVSESLSCGRYCFLQLTKKTSKHEMLEKRMLRGHGSRY